MVGTIVARAAGVVAVPTVAGLAWRRARQRKVAKALPIDTANTTVEHRFVRSVDDQWIQLPACQETLRRARLGPATQGS